MATIPRWIPTIGGAFAEPLSQVHSLIGQNLQTGAANYGRARQAFETDVNWDRQNQQAAREDALRQWEATARLQEAARQNALYERQRADAIRESNLGRAWNAKLFDVQNKQFEDSLKLRQEEFGARKAEQAENEKKREQAAAQANKLKWLGFYSSKAPATERQWAKLSSGLPAEDVEPYNWARDQWKRNELQNWQSKIDTARSLEEELNSAIAPIATANGKMVEIPPEQLEPRIKTAVDNLRKKYKDAQFWASVDIVPSPDLKSVRLIVREPNPEVKWLNPSSKPRPVMPWENSPAPPASSPAPAPSTALPPQLPPSPLLTPPGQRRPVTFADAAEPIMTGYFNLNPDATRPPTGFIPKQAPKFSSVQELDAARASGAVRPGSTVVWVGPDGKETIATVN